MGERVPHATNAPLRKKSEKETPIDYYFFLAGEGRSADAKKYLESLKGGWKEIVGQQIQNLEELKACLRIKEWEKAGKLAKRFTSMPVREFFTNKVKELMQKDSESGPVVAEKPAVNQQESAELKGAKSVVESKPQKFDIENIGDPTRNLLVKKYHAKTLERYASVLDEMIRITERAWIMKVNGKPSLRPTAGQWRFVATLLTHGEGKAMTYATIATEMGSNVTSVKDAVFELETFVMNKTGWHIKRVGEATVMLCRNKAH